MIRFPSLFLLDGMNNVQSDRGRDGVEGQATDLRKGKALQCALNFGPMLRRPLLAVRCYQARATVVRN